MVALLWRLLDAGVTQNEPLGPKEKELLEKLQNLKAVKIKDDSLIFNTRFIAGYLEFNASGSAYLRALQPQFDELYVDKEYLEGAQNGDLVVARRIISAKSSSSGAVVLIVQSASRKILSIVRDGKFLDILTSSELTTTLDALDFLPESILELNFEGTEVVKNYGILEDAKIDEVISLARFNRPDTFDDDLIASLPVTIPQSDTRVDLSELDFCTIDPKGAKDYDDAIYYDKQKRVLYVAIADVSAFVTEGTAVDIEARRRGFSIYFSHRAVPMLPHKLSEELCSLQPDVERLAFVCEMHIDALQIQSSRFYEAKIKSANRFTYEEVDEHLENPGTFDEKFGYVKHLYDLTQKIRHERLKKGLDFVNTEIRQHLDESLNLIETSFENSTSSHELIEECMLLCNVEAAKMMKGRGLFRVHDKPSLQKLAGLYEQLGSLGIPIKHQENVVDMYKKIQKVASQTLMKEQIDTILIQSQMQARYFATSSEHFGLGFETYTHFTSPIRRYSDLIVHRLIKKRLASDEKGYKELMKDMESIGLDISEKERVCDQVQSDFTARVNARWAKNNIDTLMKANIVATRPRGVAKTISPIAGLRVLLENSQHSLFDEVHIKITDADILTTTIFGTIVEN